jgi:hypothetical protein
MVRTDRSRAPAGKLQYEDQTHHIVREEFAGASGVREHEIALQGLDLVVRNASLCQQTESGIDPVGRLLALHDAAYHRRARVELTQLAAAERDANRRARDASQGRQIEPAQADFDGVSASAASTPGHPH